MERRVFIKLSGGTLVCTATGSLFYGPKFPKQLKDSLAFRLASQLPPLDGVFVFDDSVCRATATDYGSYVHRLPIGVLFPRTAQDVQRIVLCANAQGLKVAMRGHGCCAYGQSQVDRGIVIDAATLNKVSWATSDSVDAGPGATWQDVTGVAMLKGMTPPVLPDTLVLTVGGTLSAGGMGETSYRLGAQVDHVTELDVVTGKGDLLTCSPTQNEHLFSAVLAGMGQCGLIVRARTRLLPAPTSVVIRELQCADRSSFLSDLTLMAAEEASGAIGGSLLKSPDHSWKYSIRVTDWSDSQSADGRPSWVSKVSGRWVGEATVTTYNEYVNRRTQSYLNAVTDGSILVPHAYMSFFLPAAATVEMIDYITTNSEATLGATTVPVFPMLTKNFKQVLQKMPVGDLAFHIRIYRTAAKEGSAEHLRMIKSNTEDFVPRVLIAGGTVYPPHSPLLTSNQWLQHYGQSTMSFFSAAKKQYDPGAVLNPGASVQ